EAARPRAARIDVEVGEPDVEVELRLEERAHALVAQAQVDVGEPEGLDGEARLALRLLLGLLGRGRWLGSLLLRGATRLRVLEATDEGKDPVGLAVDPDVG